MHKGAMSNTPWTRRDYIDSCFWDTRRMGIRDLTSRCAVPRRIRSPPSSQQNLLDGPGLIDFDYSYVTKSLNALIGYILPYDFLFERGDVFASGGYSEKTTGTQRIKVGSDRLNGCSEEPESSSSLVKKGIHTSRGPGHTFAQVLMEYGRRIWATIGGRV
ncbi:hypothetical protein GQ44DRAFT_706426 [Phaeosphaeriaceae sp. PMI808]|nr:hypothetical protein GQ44DRAFT_706426 [Phaeosphaeriaceae sp. PMI808]